MIKQFYFEQFISAKVICLHTVSVSNSSIWPIDRTLSGATILRQNEPGSDDNEEVLHIPQSSIDWSLAIRLFNVISRTLDGESYP